jgi:hypothetical protein
MVGLLKRSKSNAGVDVHAATSLSNPSIDKLARCFDVLDWTRLICNHSSPNVRAYSYLAPF